VDIMASKEHGSKVSDQGAVVVGFDLGDVALTNQVGKGLDQVESLLVGELAVGEQFLTEATLHLAKAGGKRFRPLFTLLAAQLGPDPSDPSVITSATVVELVHLATLYHDDVMDEAQMRRGAPSANSRWTNSIAILAGDYLFAHASRLVSTLGSDAVRITAETFQHLVTGQMRETMGAQPGQDPVEHYLRVVWEKTGSLISLAGRLGATFACALPEQVERMAKLGDVVGTAFQLSDDIIDIASVSEQSGKTPGTDLREGVHTLPVLYALQEPGPIGDRLRSLLAAPLRSDDEVVEALNLLEKSNGMTRAKEKLHEYANQALTELAALPGGPANVALTNLVKFTIDRVG
jgi:heptaprenyl diphosphate synthase